MHVVVQNDMQNNYLFRDEIYNRLKKKKKCYLERVTVRQVVSKGRIRMRDALHT